MNIEERHMLEIKKRTVKTLLNKLSVLPDDFFPMRDDSNLALIEELVKAVEEMVDAAIEYDSEIREILREFGQFIYKVTEGEVDFLDEMAELMGQKGETYND